MSAISGVKNGEFSLSFLTPDIPPNLFCTAYIMLNINGLDQDGENFIFGVDISYASTMLSVDASASE